MNLVTLACWALIAFNHNKETYNASITSVN